MGDAKKSKYMKAFQRGYNRRIEEDLRIEEAKRVPGRRLVHTKLGFGKITDYLDNTENLKLRELSNKTEWNTNRILKPQLLTRIRKIIDDFNLQLPDEQTSIEDQWQTFRQHLSAPEKYEEALYYHLLPFESELKKTLRAAKHQKLMQSFPSLTQPMVSQALQATNGEMPLAEIFCNNLVEFCRLVYQWQTDDGTQQQLHRTEILNFLKPRGPAADLWKYWTLQARFPLLNTADLFSAVDEMNGDIEQARNHIANRGTIFVNMVDVSFTYNVEDTIESLKRKIQRSTGERRWPDLYVPYGTPRPLSDDRRIVDVLEEIPQGPFWIGLSIGFRD